MVPIKLMFYKQKTKKPNRTETEKNRAKPEKPSQNRENRAKTGKTEPNRFEPVFTLKPNRTEIGRFDPVSVWFRVFLKKKISIWLHFFL
jgi:hypothetical protein